MSVWNAISPWSQTADRNSRDTISAGEKIIHSGDFHIDLDSRSATVQGERLQLTSDEFDILVFLTRHPQSVVTPRTMLMTRWSAHTGGRAEFLKGLVSLQKKLEAVDSRQHYLRTEPWIIYRFDPVAPSRY